MGFKTGLVIGLGVGYVLGARAGRERYEEIRRGWEQLRRTELTAAGRGVERASAAVRQRLGRENGTP